MIRIILGIVLFVIGCINVGTADGWIGAIILGPIVGIQGYKSMRNSKKEKEKKAFFINHEEDLRSRLLAREPIDNIANYLYTNNNIPVFQTYNFFGELLMNELNDTHKKKINATQRILKAQKQDFNTDISNDIGYFSTETTIIKYDDSAHIYVKDEKKNGLLLLSKSHILFFPEHESMLNKVLEKGWDKIWDKLYETPIFFIPLFIDLFFAVKSEVQKPLSKSKLKNLKNKFDKGKCIQLTITDIDEIETIKKKSWIVSNSCVLITTSTGNQLCLGTNETNAKQWVIDMSKQIRIIALAEGKNLFLSKNVA